MKIININKEKIKYKVELKKENEKFIQKYEGNYTNCLIENLTENTEYEVRIGSFYNDIESWSEIKKIKTLDLDLNIDSNILDLPKKNEYLKKIYEWTGGKKMQLLYRGSRDGTSCKAFHEKCDKESPTICLYKNEKNNIFGGYTNFIWTSPDSRTFYPDKYSFIFTLSNIYDIEPTKFPILNCDRSIRHEKGEGPTFGGNPNITNPDIGVYSDYIKEESFSGFPESYKDTVGKGHSIFTGIKDHYFKVKEIEVFKIFNK